MPQPVLDVRVEVQGLDRVQRLMHELPPVLFAGVKKELGKGLLKIQGDVQARIQSGANNSLHTRTGQLRRSWQVTLKGTSFETLDAQFWSDSPYAYVHEGEGTGTSQTIRAKHAYSRVPGGPYLNIPLAANKTPAGVTRMQAREVFGQGGYLIRSRSGKWIVMLNSKPMFVLVRQVRIPSRLRLREILDQNVAVLWTTLNEIPLPTT